MMAGNRPSRWGRITSALSRAPSRIGISTSRSRRIPSSGTVCSDCVFTGVQVFWSSGLASSVGELDLHLFGELAPIGEFRLVPLPRFLERRIGHRLDHLFLEGGLHGLGIERLH